MKREREREGEGGSSRGKGRETSHTWDTKVKIEDVRDNHERTIRIWREYRRVKNITRLQNCGNRKAITQAHKWKKHSVWWERVFFWKY